MRNSEREILEKDGWQIDCESPLEISKKGSIATGFAARIVIHQLIIEHDYQKESEHLLNDKYFIIKDLKFSDFMKDEKGNLMLFESKEEVMNTCGMYEFPDVLVCQIKENYKD